MKIIICSKAEDCQEVENVAEQVELMIMIGNKKSSKSNEIYELVQKISGNVMYVEGIEDLYVNYVKRFKIVGIVYDYEVSQDIVDKVIEIVRKLETEKYIYENNR